MKKSRFILITIIVLIIGISICLVIVKSNKERIAISVNNNERIGEINSMNNINNLNKDISESKMEYTNVVPSEYFNKAEKQGKVQKIEYQTYDYTENSKTPITKPAFVYTPYGYDENDKNTKYNVFFFMHGWTGTADEYFFLDNNAITNILDNMIEDNLIKPTIVVALTFDSKNKSQSFGRSTDEIAVYNQELKNDLLPFIDNNYNTYGTREHRAFGGFSLGAVTTWYQFQYNLDLIKYFIPMSGDSWIVEMYGGRYEPNKTAKKLKEIADNSNLDFFICQTNGTQDAVFSQPDNQMKAMFKLKDTFNSSNLIYLMKQNGYHDFYAIEECTYNGLQKIFK